MSDLRKQVFGVLVYLLVVKCIDLLMKSIVSPRLEKMGFSKNHSQCIRLALEITTIVLGLMVLKKKVINKNK